MSTHYMSLWDFVCVKHTEDRFQQLQMLHNVGLSKLFVAHHGQYDTIQCGVTPTRSCVWKVRATWGCKSSLGNVSVDLVYPELVMSRDVVIPVCINALRNAVKINRQFMNTTSLVYPSKCATLSHVICVMSGFGVSFHFNLKEQSDILDISCFVTE